jgi:excisionase family DNA binding protein
MKRANDLTVQQAALRLGVTLKYVRDLLYEGKLPGATKLGRKWAIPAAAVNARLKQREATNQQ